MEKGPLKVEIIDLEHAKNPNFSGVRKRKSGKYVAEKWDPIKKIRVWSGTFNTIEEANEAYLAKQREFTQLNQGCNQSTDYAQHMFDEMPSSNSTNPIKEKGVWFGTFDTAEEASEAYLAKQCEFAQLENHGFSQSTDYAHHMFDEMPSSNLTIKSGAAKTSKTHHGKKPFNTAEEASNAYLAKQREFAQLNQVPASAQRMFDEMSSSMIKAQSSNSAERSNADHGKKPFIRETNFSEKLLGAEWQKIGRLRKDPFKKKQGTKSADGCNTVMKNPKAKRRSLLGIRRQKNGKYGAVIRDPIRHERVWLGTFNTAEQASKAYLAKQCEFAQPVTANQACNQSPSSNLTKKSGAPKRSKADYGKMPFIREISSCDKRPLLGVESQNMGILKKDHLKKKQVCSDTLEPGKEASKGIINSNMHGYEKVVKVNQGKEPIICVESSKETSCLMSKSSDDGRNNVTLNPKSKSGLRGIRKQKNGKFGAEIRDLIRHKQVWLGTFDTVEEAEQAYLSKKSEFHMLRQRKKENKPKHCDQILHAASVGGNKKMDSPKTTCIVGVNKNKWGRYTSEIINPISMKKIWLGTFGTYEEASQAYQSKKLEFQKLVKPKKKCNKKIHEKQVGKEKLVNVNQGHVNCEAFQPKSTAEETFHANQYMKFDAERSKEAELQSNMPNEDADLWTGQWVQLPGGKEVNFSLKLGLPIIDNYGSLLGEFSSLDDLRIYQTGDDNE
ncbi:uncharacterized protein LOC132615000 [Lycium barbarum]|uniref:uncharacterized protein LOC132615000 n=1 Tax=Lycium barbarum TaxID=112863 RepID=UPI00293E197E|nr:uncharacterized protein LOC132615000 [Lycium barbarum]